ncbi:MAG: type II toxin-antitoxin system RelE/ParE family toxin [Pseudomonadota bacterium]|nr:type II toxin-antitoxin system RelE/ParE family toxin [Pseudomonadota bacterium]
MLSIVWADEARADLLGIVRYVAERNPSAAVQLGRAIEQSTWPLPQNPYLFKRSERVEGCREIVVHRNYILIYRVRETIEVLRVVHARQEYP